MDDEDDDDNNKNSTLDGRNGNQYATCMFTLMVLMQTICIFVDV